VIDELDRELRVRGVPARRRRRIRLELEDHLACDPSADLGVPSELARQFADELGTAYARRAGLAVFAVLVPFGLLFSVLLLLASVHVGNPVPLPLMLALVAGVQLAFVGGTLAALRAWRLRRLPVIPAEEARILVRRAGVAVLGAALTLVSLGYFASGFYPAFWWTVRVLPWVTFGVGIAAVMLGSAAAVRAWRLLPVADGEAHDLSFDLGVTASPRRIALVIAVTVALCIALAGVVQSDPIDGLARGLADGLLCLAGFALLGRWLGLRRQVA
jgi:hypothetical protein